jgi:hypothetical protein
LPSGRAVRGCGVVVRAGRRRVEITSSREGTKPRSSDEKRTIFRQSPRAASVESFLGKGHPRTMAPSARRARMCSRSHSGAGGRLGLRARWSWTPAEGAFPGLDFGKRSPFLNYNLAATGQPQSAQSSQRTHKEIRGSLQHRYPCGDVGSSAR